MKNVIITGANSGLGFETAKKIAANKEYRVILACRNMVKAQAAKEDIIAATGNENVEVQIIDTSSFESVRNFAKNIIDSGIRIDVLINNAGISSMRGTGLTADGFDIVFETNYLGHFLLTLLLLPVMNADCRIINITSDMHNPPYGLTWPGVEKIAYGDVDTRLRYSYTKLCMIYFTHALVNYFEKTDKTFVANSFNPGFMADTNFSQGNGKARELMVKLTAPDRYSTLAQSSTALAEVATSPALADVTDQYFDRSTNTIRSSALSYNQHNAVELWNDSLKFCHPS